MTIDSREEALDSVKELLSNNDFFAMFYSEATLELIRFRCSTAGELGTSIAVLDSFPPAVCGIRDAYEYYSSNDHDENALSTFAAAAWPWLSILIHFLRYTEFKIPPVEGVEYLWLQQNAAILNPESS